MVSEAFVWSDDHVGIGEEAVEEVPGVFTVGGGHPDVGGMFASIDGESQEGEALSDELGVLHVVLNGGAHLLLPFGCEDGFGTTLRDVAGTIELAALATVPEGVETRAICPFQFLRDDGVAATDACEACCLGEASELDGTLLGTLNLINGVGK